MKFKNIKKKPKKRKLPSNSRIIPVLQESKGEYPKLSFLKFNLPKALNVYKKSLEIFVILFFLLAFVVVGLDFYDNFQIKQGIDQERTILLNDLNTWKAFMKEHKDYKTAYFQAAVLEYKLGNIVNAKSYVKKGLNLDPNSVEGKKIEDFLGNK